MNTTVIKLGGGVLKNEKIISPLLSSVHSLLDQNHRMVFVHGGGSQADDMHEKLDVPIEKVNGRRVTDADSLEISKMVYRGTLNVNLVSDCLKHDIPSAGITGVDGKTVLVKKRPPVTIDRGNEKHDGKTVDFGFVGDIVTVNPQLLNALIEQQLVPIVGCLGVDEKGQVYNVNADTMASAIAAGLSADRLVYVTTVSGILEHEDADTSFSNVTLDEADQMIENGQITKGMIPKMDSARSALENDVQEVLITGTLEKEDDWREALQDGTHGTTITTS